jgi:Rrf2 family protein
MRISQKGLYALQATSMLSRHYKEGAIRIHDIAAEENLPEKFLELILLELKYARLVESVRGARGGYRLRRAPEQIFLSEIIRTIDGPLAPFGDAESLRMLISNDAAHRPLFRIFMDLRDAAARILENTSLADISGDSVRPRRKVQAPRQSRAENEKRRREVQSRSRDDQDLKVF